MNYSRRGFLRSQFAVALTTAAWSAGVPISASAKAQGSDVLGQGRFQFRADPHWAHVDPALHPVKDCNAIAEDKAGRIIVLTDETANNLLAFDKAGRFISAREHRFPKAHGLQIAMQHGQEQFWITDTTLGVVSVVDAQGVELHHVGPDAIPQRFKGEGGYRPSNVAVTEDGDFFISDGYGSSFVHHFDRTCTYVASFGGEGDAPEQFRAPHSVSIDDRSGSPHLLICDRDHESLKWFSMSAKFERSVHLPGSAPSNVSIWGEYLAVACWNGIVLILDGADRVVSVVGGDAARHESGVLQPLNVRNGTFTHPHDVHVDAGGSIYVAQGSSNSTYPIKLVPVEEATKQST